MKDATKKKTPKGPRSVFLTRREAEVIMSVLDAAIETFGLPPKKIGKHLVTAVAKIDDAFSFGLLDSVLREAAEAEECQE